MASNTKIARYDLSEDLEIIFTQLDQLKSDQLSTDIFEILTNINASMLADDEKEVMTDLINGFLNDGKGLTIPRIRVIEKTLETFAESLEKLELAIKNLATSSLIEGNLQEVFTYDPIYGNVTNHAVTGDKTYNVAYNYADEENGVLSTSLQTLVDNEGQDVAITKTYVYDALGNITDINTVTVITPVVI